MRDVELFTAALGLLAPAQDRPGAHIWEQIRILVLRTRRVGPHM